MATTGTRHGENTAYPEMAKIKLSEFHLTCEINKNGQAKTPVPPPSPSGPYRPNEPMLNTLFVFDETKEGFDETKSKRLRERLSSSRSITHVCQL